MVRNSTYFTKRQNTASGQHKLPNGSTIDEKSTAFTEDVSLKIAWEFGDGVRAKWVQRYITLSEAISFADVDIVAFDIRGSNISGNVGFELKFEGNGQAAWVKWENLARLYRWGNKITALKKQFENYQTFDWSDIHIVSLSVYNDDSTGPENGYISIRNFISSNTSDWIKGEMDPLATEDYNQIKMNAIYAIINRQQPTGLLETWQEDGSASLYGQGLALKALCIEGTWDGVTPLDSSAQTAENLALFLAANQEPQGYWPRAWDSATGDVRVLLEQNNTIWMGDFPWPLIGLQCYYKKTGDERVLSAIENALVLLSSLIDEYGQLHTQNMVTLELFEETSCEANAAVLLSLYESDENALADLVWSKIVEFGWDDDLRVWKEWAGSSRIALFANTWLAPFLIEKGETQMALDSLSLAGKALYTCGPGEPGGLDGIIPLAVWYEGTLSYISAGGPGSSFLFDNLVNYINTDGTVCHYNDNFDSIGGIWAVDWHSLDGTSWLYFAASGISPFTVLEGS